MELIKKIIFLLSFQMLFIAFNLKAQCPVANFILPDSICTNEQINLINTSSGANSFFWDFCAGDLELTPTGTNLGDLGTTYNGINRFKIVKDNGQYYGFLTDFALSQITRLDFGNNIYNIPIAVVLGTSIPNAGGIDFINENGIWYALVTSVFQDALYRLDFTSITDLNPNLNLLGNPASLSTPVSLQIIKDNNQVHAFVVNTGNNSLSRLDFGSSVTGIPTGVNFGTIPNTDLVYDIEIQKFCDDWVGLMPSVLNGNIIRITIGSIITDTPQYFNLGNFGLTASSGLSLALDGGQIYAFYGEFNQNTFHKLSFGSDIFSTPQLNSYGNLGTIDQPRSVYHYSDSSKNLVLISNYNSKTITRITFADNCSSSPAVSHVENPTISYTQPGSHITTLIATDSLGNTHFSNDTIIAISSLPQSNFSVSTDSICFNDTIYFYDNSFQPCGTLDWFWSFDDGDTSTLQNPWHVFDPGVYSVKLIVTNQFSESDTSIMIITILGVNPSFTVNDGCVSDSLFFQNNTYNPLNSNINWLWDFGDNNSSLIFEPKHLYSGDGNYTVMLTATANGCVDSISAPVDFFLKPNSDFESYNTCSGDTVQFFNNTSPLPPGTIFNWDFGDTNSSSLQDPIHPYSNIPDNYIVTLISTSPNGCSDTASKIIQIANEPVAHFTYSPTLTCEGNPISFIDQSTVAGDTITGWTWYFGTGDSSIIKNPTYIYSSAGLYNVTLIANAGTDCKNDTVLNIVINESPDADFTFNNVCFGNYISFTDNSQSPSGTSIIQWEWDFGDSTTSGLQNPSHLYSNPGVYNVLLTVTDNNLGCSNTISYQVEIYELPIADYSFSNFCSGKNTQFTDLSLVPGSTIDSWSWDFGDPGSGSNNISSSQHPTHTFNESGNYIVQLIASSSFGCIDTVTKQIEIKRTPNANFTSTEVCDGEFVSFTYLDNIIPTNANYWFWEFGNGATSTISDPATLYLTWGIYNVTLIVGDTLTNCVDTITKPITIYPQPNAAIPISTPCMGIPFTLTDSSNISIGNIQNWQWIISETSDTLNGQSNIYTFPNSGTYHITLLIVSDKGCVDSTTINMEVSDLPDADFTFSPSYGGAPPLTVNFNNSSLGAVSYQWSFGDGSTSTEISPIHIYQDTGLMEVSLIVQNEFGCNDTLKKSIPIIQQVLDVAVIKMYTEYNQNFINLKADLFNFGTRDINSFYITAKIENRPVIKEYWSGTLSSGEMMNYEFHSLFETLGDEDYICITVSEPNNEPDNVPINNQLCNSFVEDLQILSLFPNPGYNIYSLQYNLPLPGNVLIDIVDEKGSLISTLFDGQANKGFNRFSFSANAKSLSVGTYILRIKSNNSLVSTRLIKF